MASQTGRWLPIVAAAALAFPLAPTAPPAQAQGWGDSSASSWNRDRNRSRWDRGDRRHDRERERERRKDAKTDGIVAGVVGTAILVGVIAAASKKDKNRDRDRRTYCEDRYGSYDERTDTYRAADGRWYPC